MLNEITVVAAQHALDGSRFEKLGLKPEKIVITGSIKFDLDLTSIVQKQSEVLRKSWHGVEINNREVLLAASTHPGEDETVLSIFKEAKKLFPALLLVLVPRHPERFNSVYQLCLQQGFQVERRSGTKNNADHVVQKNIDIVLGDTMGELLALYGACDIAFVGGSLVPIGGHNFIEPAAWGKPIVSGRHVFNFSEVANLLTEQQALIICDDEKQLCSVIIDLLSRQSKRLAMGVKGRQVAIENRGALERLVNIIDKNIMLSK